MKRIIIMLSLSIVLAIAFVACNDGTLGTPETSGEDVTPEIETDGSTVEVEISTVETEVPTSEADTTDTEASSTESVTTETIITEPVTTEPITTEPVTEAPAPSGGGGGGGGTSGGGAAVEEVHLQLLLTLALMDTTKNSTKQKRQLVPKPDTMLT